MATVNKDFKIKSGLIVEGSSATVGGYDVLTKKQDDQDYIVSIIGGTATSANDPSSVVKRDASGNFSAGTITADVTGNVTGTVSSLSNHDTDDLSEGTSNKYFTNQRALDATNSAYDAAGLAGQAYSDALTDANLYTDGEISSEVTNRNSAILTAKGQAISDANDYTDGEITTALSTAATDASNKRDAAKSYSDGLISTEVTNRNSAISTAKGEATSDANDYTDTAIGQEVTDRNSAISTAITNLDLSNTYDAKGDAAQALADANTYTDGKVSDLVDSAPDLLNTLNELAAAIADNPNYATDVASAVSGRVAKSGDTMTGDLVLPGAPTLNLHAATKKYVDDTAATAQGNAEDYADTVAGTAYTNAVSDAEGYADSLAVNYDAAGDAAQAYTDAVSAAATDATTKAGNALSDANDYTDSAIGTEVTNRNSAISSAIGTEVTNRNSAISSAIGTEVTNRNSAITTAVDALTTSDIEEGSNLYFTDSRAKTSAADLLTGATKTNITITGTGAGLTITAENGVADSDTDDLVEGSSNLYFTAQRAVDALEAVTPVFGAVDLNSVAVQVAELHSVPTASVNNIVSWAKADYRSGEFLVKIANGTHTQISKILLTLDTSDNVAITEYGMVGTNGSLGSVSADVSGDDVRVLVTTDNNSSTVMVVGTILK